MNLDTNLGREEKGVILFRCGKVGGLGREEVILVRRGKVRGTSFGGKLIKFCGGERGEDLIGLEGRI